MLFSSITPNFSTNESAKAFCEIFSKPFGRYLEQLASVVPTELTKILHRYHPAQIFAELITSTLASNSKYIIYVGYGSNSKTPFFQGFRHL